MIRIQFSDQTHLRSLRAAVLCAACVLTLACGGPQPRPLPPSASDLPLLGSSKICDSRSRVSEHRKGESFTFVAWGTGEELRVPAKRGTTAATESYFFDEDGLLVGYLIVFPDGLELKPYAVLRETLSQLKPSVEFFLSLSGLRTKGTPESSALFATGDVLSTTQYLVQGPVDSGRLLIATVAIDPYFQLLSPFRRDILTRLRANASGPAPQAGTVDQDPLPSLQQFARGETALLGYCGTRDEALAADAYQKAVKTGFSTPRLVAEAHHKLGLAWKAQGQLERARKELEQSLSVAPNRPDVLNNLGQVYKELGRRNRAIELFTQAVALRPNYPIARFNLAEAYESQDARRAVEEYETYLALAEDVLEEQERVRRARSRVEELNKR